MLYAMVRIYSIKMAVKFLHSPSVNDPNDPLTRPGRARCTTCSSNRVYHGSFSTLQAWHAAPQDLLKLASYCLRAP